MFEQFKEGAFFLAVVMGNRERPLISKALGDRIYLNKEEAIKGAEEISATYGCVVGVHEIDIIRAEGADSKINTFIDCTCPEDDALEGWG